MLGEQERYRKEPLNERGEIPIRWEDNCGRAHSAAKQQQMQGCMLGHSLGDCPAKRAGCGSHYEMLRFMMPPWAVREHIRATMGDDPGVRQWLARLDAVLKVTISRNRAHM